MPEEVYVVAFDDQSGDLAVLDCAIGMAKRSGAKLNIVHVLEWSPYSFLTQEELAERHARRNEELSRAKSAVLAPAIEHARAEGVTADGEVRHGQTIELITRAASDSGASLIFVGRTGSSIGARIFGSVPLGLSQVATVPVVIVP